MKIGIFGGSFDPVHNEHIALVKSAVESLSLDRLFVVPAKIPPHKIGKTLSDDQARFELCKLAFEKIDRVEVSDCELKHDTTSYSYLTVERFKQEYPNAELFFLLGTDMLRDFPTWRYPLRILENCTLAVCARAEESGWVERERESFKRKTRSEKDFVTIGYQGKAVSSTRIRVLAAAGEDLSPFVPQEVERYIKERGLYRINGAQEALALEKQTRKEHSLRVAFFAAEHAKEAGVDEKRAITAALFHDCAKNLAKDSPLLRGFVCPQGVPPQVWHQYAGRYLCEKLFGIQDEDVLNAVKYHTSGRENMSPLEKLIFLADMLEEGRTYKEVEELRGAFRTGIDQGLELALLRTLEFLEEKGEDIYPLTQRAYEYIKKNKEK